MHLVELFAAARERHGRRPALVSVEDGAAFTYEDLFDRAEDLAGRWVTGGLAAGDRVAFYSGNRVELVVGYLAALEAGAVVVPMNLAYRRRELSHILLDAAPRLVIAEGEGVEAIRGLASETLESVRDVLPVESLLDSRRSAAGTAGATRSPDEPAMLLYTSGTTGRSKGAVLSHANVAATVAALLESWRWSSEDRLHLALPIFHTHGLVVGLFCALAAGATVLLARRFEAKRVLHDLATERANLFFGVPTLYSRLVSEIETTGSPDLSGVRLFCSGSAPLPAEVLETFRGLTGHAILERYGMTETGMLLSNPYDGERIPGTVGTPLPGVEARLVDGEGAVVPAGIEGELQVRGANVFAGYWRDRDKTAASFVEDGTGHRWFRTGDLARRDAATGYYTLLGRHHELIVSGGYNVYPREVEEVLLEHPAVAEAAVVGRPHPEWGEAPEAFIVLATAAAAGPDELRLHCRERVAAYKAPARFRFVDELPRNALGKVQKHLLPP